MVDLNKVIENPVEMELYTKKINEIQEYLKTFGKKIFGR